MSRSCLILEYTPRTRRTFVRGEEELCDCWVGSDMRQFDGRGGRSKTQSHVGFTLTPIPVQVLQEEDTSVEFLKGAGSQSVVSVCQHTQCVRVSKAFI